mgnify:CR=1 FL=1
MSSVRQKNQWKYCICESGRISLGKFKRHGQGSRNRQDEYKRVSGERGNGQCARLETHIESVKVLGMVNITVLASGSMFLGDMKEPITGTKDGEKNLNSGVAFYGTSESRTL